MKLNHCDTSPCLNNGTCIDQISSFLCQCNVAWTGKTCDLDINECKYHNPCKNNGTCINQNGGYFSNCSEFWEGFGCENDKDECQENPCGPGLKCKNKVFGYECVDCTHYICENGGKCNDTVNGPVCTCTSRWTGNQCEKRITVKTILVEL